MACESRSVANQAGEWRVDENEFEVNGNGRPKATRVFSGSLTFARCKSFKAGRAIRPAIPSRGGYGHIPKSISCWHHSTLKAFSPAIPSCGGMARIPNQSIYRWHHSKLIRFQPSHSIMRRLWPDPKSILLAPFDKAFIPSWLWPCSQKHLYCWHHSLKLSARPFHHVAAMAIPKSSYCWHQSLRAFFCLYRSTSSARNLIIESQFSRWA